MISCFWAPSSFQGFHHFTLEDTGFNSIQSFLFAAPPSSRHSQVSCLYACIPHSLYHCFLQEEVEREREREMRWWLNLSHGTKLACGIHQERKRYVQKLNKEKSGFGSLSLSWWPNISYDNGAMRPEIVLRAFLLPWHVVWGGGG